MIPLPLSRCAGRPVLWRFVPLVVALVLTGAARADVLDDFSSVGAWSLIAADGVRGAIVEDGGALRLDYDFSAGAGYCVVRRRVDLPLDPNYRFGLRYRGTGPRNTLEFKLVDPSGENVWWNVRRGIELPADWETLSLRRRHFSFAWGPDEGALQRVGYIEIAVTADAGGRGSLWLDDLSYEALPEWSPEPIGPRALGPDGADLGRAGDDGSFGWSTEGPGVLTLRFDELVEFSAIEIDWSDGRAPAAYRLEASADDATFRTIGGSEGSSGGTDVVFTPECEARAVRLVVDGAAAIDAVRFLPVERLTTSNDYFALLASRAPRGAFPPYYERLTAWTVVGLPGRDDEALVSAVGAVEPIKAGPSLEPFLVEGGRVLSWADAAMDHTLEDGSLPIPTVRWRLDGLQLEITAVATEHNDAGRLLVRYRLTNEDQTARSALMAGCSQGRTARRTGSSARTPRVTVCSVVWRANASRNGPLPATGSPPRRCSSICRWRPASHGRSWCRSRWRMGPSRTRSTKPDSRGRSLPSDRGGPACWVAPSCWCLSTRAGWPRPCGPTWPTS